ncbi:MAG: hypothetical protein WB614_16225 [Pseudolabrys sp.]
MSAENMQALRPSVSAAVGLAPGIALSAVVAAIGYVTAPYVARFVPIPIPSTVIALVVGIALNPLAARGLRCSRACSSVSKPCCAGR